MVKNLLKEPKKKKKKKKVLQLTRKSSSPPVSQRKDPPEQIHAATSAPPAEMTLADSTLNKVLSVIANPVPYVDVTPRGSTKHLSPMTERWANNEASIGNTTISTLTILENVHDLKILVKKCHNQMQGQ